MECFIRWPGSKTRELKTISPLIPLFSGRFIEPFIGSGAVFLKTERPGCINDLDPELAKLWSMSDSEFNHFKFFIQEMDASRNDIRNASLTEKMEDSEIAKRVPLLFADIQYAMKSKRRLLAKEAVTDPVSIIRTGCFAAHYYQIRRRYNELRALEQFPAALWPERVACFFFLREMAFSSMFRTSKEDNKFNVPYSGFSYNNRWLEPKVDKLEKYRNSDFARKSSVYNLDFEDFFNSVNPGPDDFIFLDPPYDSAFSDYGVGSFTIEDQMRLKNAVMDTGAKFMAVMKATPTIVAIWDEPGFQHEYYDLRYATNMKNRNDQSVQHIMVTNYQ